MPQVCWQVSANGGYWMDVELGGVNLRIMIDLGLIDPRDQVGVELEPALYDALHKRGTIVSKQARRRRDASGAWFVSQCGTTTASLLCPLQRQPVVPGF